MTNTQEDLKTPTTDDATLWAKSFIAHMNRNKWSLEDVDESLMLGWFANAIEVSCDARSKPLTLEKAREIAAQCWCDKETESIEMDVRLAEAFARRIAKHTRPAEPLPEDKAHALEVFTYMCKRWTETKHKVTIDQDAQRTIKAALTAPAVDVDLLGQIEKDCELMVHSLRKGYKQGQVTFAKRMLEDVRKFKGHLQPTTEDE